MIPPYRQVFRFSAAIVTIFLLCANATAQTKQIIAIKAGRLADVEAGRMLADQVILVDGERIGAIGPAARALEKVRFVMKGGQVVKRE